MINMKNIAVLLFCLVVPGITIAQTEVLYNGIHLPEQWPAPLCGATKSTRYADTLS